MYLQKTKWTGEKTKELVNLKFMLWYTQNQIKRWGGGYCG